MRGESCLTSASRISVLRVEVSCGCRESEPGIDQSGLRPHAKPSRERRTKYCIRPSVSSFSITVAWRYQGCADRTPSHQVCRSTAGEVWFSSNPTSRTSATGSADHVSCSERSIATVNAHSAAFHNGPTRVGAGQVELRRHALRSCEHFREK